MTNIITGARYKDIGKNLVDKNYHKANVKDINAINKKIINSKKKKLLSQSGKKELFEESSVNFDKQINAIITKGLANLSEQSYPESINIVMNQGTESSDIGITEEFVKHNNNKMMDMSFTDLSMGSIDDTDTVGSNYDSCSSGSYSNISNYSFNDLSDDNPKIINTSYKKKEGFSENKSNVFADFWEQNKNWILCIICFIIIILIGSIIYDAYKIGEKPTSYVTKPSLNSEIRNIHTELQKTKDIIAEIIRSSMS